MNWLVLVSGLFALFTVIGHFAMGIKSFLKPMLDAPFDDVPKKVVHCVFHYISAFLVLSAGVLLAVGLGMDFKADTSLLVKFIALNYGVFAVTQIFYAITSNIKNAVFKLFQWTFFVLIAVFAWLGVA